MKRKIDVEFMAVTPWGLPEEEQRKIRESFDDSILEKYLEKTYSYPEVKQELENLARDWLHAHFARFIDTDDPRRGYVEAVRGKEKFLVWPFFDRSARISKIKVFYSKNPIRELWELSDAEVLERRDRQISFVDGSINRLLEIEGEIDRRGLLG